MNKRFALENHVKPFSLIRPFLLHQDFQRLFTVVTFLVKKQMAECRTRKTN
ncbi:MAG: hypothetical protein ACLQT6_02595 [Desulfomonilaceae bacterium]